MTGLLFPAEPRTLTFTVGGEPIPQGSKTGFSPKGTNKVTMTDANRARLKPWRALVTDQARRHAELVGWEPMDGPCWIRVVFAMPVPQDRKPWMRWAHKAADGDKLLRAVCDSLQDAKVITNDARFVLYAVEKRLGHDGVGCTITVGDVDEREGACDVHALIQPDWPDE
jgi:Holliday junction resolvase RusA-like endonuclease